MGRVVAAIAVATACIDLSTDPDEIVAIEFQDFPWPSIVAGDTLRDASGAVVPLTVREILVLPLLIFISNQSTSQFSRISKRDSKQVSHSKFVVRHMMKAR